MPHSENKIKVHVPYDVYKQHERFLKSVFNACGVWLIPCDIVGFELKEGNIIALFTEKHLSPFGRKGHAAWIGKEFKEGGARCVVFPDPADDDMNDTQFELAMKVLLKVDTDNLDIRIVGTEQEIVTMLDWASKQPYLAVDFETKFLDSHQKDAKILSIAVGSMDRAYVLPIAHNDSSFFGEERLIMDVLKEIAAHPNLVMHNAKYEIRWFLSCGIKIKSIYFDTMLAHHLLDESSGHGLDLLAKLYTPYGGYEQAFEQSLIDPHDYESAPIEGLLHYNGLDVIMTSLCARELSRQLLEEPKLHALYRELILPLVPVIAQMEEHGFEIDRRELKSLVLWYEKEQTNLEEKIKNAKATYAFFVEQEVKTKKPFNFNSYPQIRKLLYDHLKFPVKRKTKKTKKGGGGNPAVDEVAIVMMKQSNKHVEVLNNILQRTKVNTIIKYLYIYGQNVVGMNDKRLRTNYNMHVVETGRLSSSKPPLQNVATNESLLEMNLKPIKSIFVSRFNNGMMIQADYKQLELRTATMYTIAYGLPDETFIRAFEHGRDLHGEMAERVYGKGFTKDQRNKAKRTNFSAVFDISAKQLAINLETTEEEAADLIKSFRALHPNLYEMFDGWWDKAKRVGWIENFLGRRRRIAKELERAEDRWQEEDIKRQVWNFPIQSTAAEMTMAGMLYLQQIISQKKFQSIIVGNVHDSIIVDAHPREIDLMCRLINRIFSGLGQVYDWITVPIEVDIAVGANLRDVKTWNLDKKS